MINFARLRQALPHLTLVVLLLVLPACLVALYIAWASEMVALGTIAARSIEVETGQAIPLRELPGYGMVMQVGTLGPLTYLLLITLPVWILTRKVGVVGRALGRFSLGAMAGFLLIG